MFRGSMRGGMPRGGFVPRGDVGNRPVRPPPPPQLKFEGEFDFETANAQFNKEQIEQELKEKLTVSEWINRLFHSVFSERELKVIVRPSVCLSVTFVHPTQAIEIFRNFVRYLVRWPSIDIQVKFYVDRLRGTPPSGELNTRGVAEYSNFGPI